MRQRGEDIGFKIEDGKVNGIMVPPSDAILKEAKLKKPSIGTHFDKYALHLGSHG